MATASAVSRRASWRSGSDSGSRAGSGRPTAGTGARTSGATGVTASASAWSTGGVTRLRASYRSAANASEVTNRLRVLAGGGQGDRHDVRRRVARGQGDAAREQVHQVAAHQVAAPTGQQRMAVHR